MAERFNGKTALVTGAGSGIGRAIALGLASEGALVGVLDWSEANARATVGQIESGGGQALALPADISNAEAMQAAVHTLTERSGGRLDLLAANAGINGVWAPIDELEPDEWRRTLDINLTGTFLTFRYATPFLRQNGGSAVITASVHGTRVFSIPGSTAYACTKAAQVAFAKKVAIELARDRVRVNVICPGSTDTHINETVTKRSLDRITLPIQFPEGKLPLSHGRKASPEEVATLALFLLSDESSFITGTEMWIDGAMSLMMG